MDPTIHNVLHKLQNLAAIPPLTPIQDLPKERYAFAIPHNTQHSSQMVKALLQFHTNMGFSRNSKNLVAIPEQQHLTFFTKNLIAIPTTPNIVAIPHPHCNSNNTQYSSQIAKSCCYSTNFQYKISPDKDMTFLHTEKIFILRDKCSKLSSSLL
jgi:hypothetical protein